MQDSLNDESPPLVPRKPSDVTGKAKPNTYVKIQESKKKGTNFISHEIMSCFQNKYNILLSKTDGLKTDVCWDYTQPQIVANFEHLWHQNTLGSADKMCC